MTENNDNQLNAAADHSEPTSVVPPPVVAAPELAWSLDDDAVEQPADRQSWGLALGQAAVMLSIGAVVALVICAVGWVLVGTQRDEQPLPVEAHVTTVAAQPSYLAAPTAVAQPSTVTVQAAPTTITVRAAPEPETTTVRVTPEPSSEAIVAPLSEATYDQRFLDRMRSLGYTITDQQLALRNAHESCRLFRQGESPSQVDQQMSTSMGASMIDAMQLVSSAMLSYPNCA